MTLSPTLRCPCSRRVSRLFGGVVLLLAGVAGAADPETNPADSLAQKIGATIPAASAVLVIPQDGRAVQTVPVHAKGEARYLPLVSLCRALGVRYTWDPYAYRGWIETDSLQTSFTLRSPILIHGGEGRQLKHGIEYDESGVLIPIEYLALLGERWHGNRMTVWNPEAATLIWGRPVGRYDRIEVTRAGHQSRLRIYGDPPPSSRVFFSPLGGLDLYLEGWAPDPESLSVESGGGRMEVRSVRWRPNGSRLLLDVTPAVAAVSTGYDERDRAWQLLATTSPMEAEDGRFHPVTHALRQDRKAPRVIILACCIDPVADPPEGIAGLRDLAQEAASVLSGSLGLEAVILEGRDAFRMAGRANGYDAHCLVGLRLDGYAQGIANVQIWSPAPRYHWKPLENQEEEKREGGTVPPFWSEVPALSAAGSERLASTLSAHIELLVGEGAVVTGRRPSRWLEGLAMPAVLIYPAVGTDPASLRELQDPERRAGLARAIAFGISEALRAAAPGGGVR